MKHMVKTRGFSGTMDNSPRAYEAPHRELSRKAATEGIVLLKNENQVLPLKKSSKVALYGAGVTRTIKGGTGSGDVNEREVVNIYQGMVDAGFVICNTDWIAEYERLYEQARQDWKQAILDKMKHSSDPNPFIEAYFSTPFYYPVGGQVEKTEADTAIYILSRVAGEGMDRLAQPGDYFLNEEEEKLIADICANYEHVIVAINTGGLVDLSFVDKYSNIQGILQIMQPGMEAGHAFADVICGDVTPSAKLVDSWAYSYQDYPNAATYSHNNGNVEEEIYEEGIYVGYRYFDSFDKPVRYSFGYGESYTKFDMELLAIRESFYVTEIEIEVKVSNVGEEYSGKEVVQVYVSCPDGKLEKEYRRLVGFAKTKELKAGESETLTIRFPFEAIASYDETEPGWILEGGYYGIWIGNSLRDAELKALLSQSNTLVLEQTENVCKPQREIRQLHIDNYTRVNRYNRWVKEALQNHVPILPIHPEVIGTTENHYDTWKDEFSAELKELLDNLSVEQLIALATGIPGEEAGSILGAAGISVPGSAGQTSRKAIEQGIASIVLADGPAGLRLTKCYQTKDNQILSSDLAANFGGGELAEKKDKEQEGVVTYYQYCTAIPVGTMLAQTWNEALVREMGTMIAEEMQEFGVTLWLAPGMNIHRNPLCGRNFEYYSEDPLVSGKMAAAITRGVQSKKGCGTTIKHFACNNQEDNRSNSDSILTERTLREIYLKGFEIAVKEAQPLSIMTSYNLINGIHSANNYDLCTKAARMEWKFSGVIMTDWGTTSSPNCTAAGCIRAGNDLVMPGEKKDHQNLRQELEQGTLSLDKLKCCVGRLVQVILQSGEYN